ncbi:MAG: hypothetical protein HC940_06425 [Acaryochloris sp. SU_5_25]|nr:hypothetical protein [Acaryochloris sp. SU_5_25]
MSLMVGSIVWGESGTRCELIGAFRDSQTGEIKLKVRCPDGDRFIAPEQIKGHASLKPPEARAPKVGDLVRLKHTTLEYTLAELFEYHYWIDGEHCTELWARLRTLEGKPATWKLNQLKTILDH